MASSLRIAMLSEHASPLASLGGVDAGGQNVYVAQLARCLGRLGHRVDVYTRRDSPRLSPVVDLAPGVRVIHVDAGPPEYVPKERLLPHMADFARSVERVMGHGPTYDAMHAHFFMSGWVAQRLRHVLGVPFAITFHALGLVRMQHQREADTFPVERISIERELAQVADAVIAECPQDREDLQRLYGADSSRVTVVPCGVDLAEFGPVDRRAARASLGLRDDEYVVLQLGRLVPRKGIDNVIRALALLPADTRARLLVVGGDGATPDETRTPEIARLRAVARECGISHRVEFTGHRGRAELRRYYGAADVFVTTPWYEPFGITPLEAMACGTPVVGSAVGGIQHSVQDNVTGFLVPANDPVALAQRLAQLQAHPALGRAMGRAGIVRTRTHFTWEQVAAKIAAVYSDLAAGAEPREDAQGAMRASTSHQVGAGSLRAL